MTARLDEATAREIKMRLGQEIEDTHSYQAACRVLNEFTQAAPDRRSKAHSLDGCWCGMPHRREDFL